MDRRQVETLRTATRVTLQIVGVLLVLLVIFGPPTQLGTFLGLAGAGLTVALKDFIVAFFGWFVLMGKNGIRLGDWVEINGVTGEVVELGMFHTVLLETGNWTDSGHPTGRRVTFTNSFAVEGHYFNFSTSGQWLWDELQISGSWTASGLPDHSCNRTTDPGRPSRCSGTVRSRAENSSTCRRHRIRSSQPNRSGRRRCAAIRTRTRCAGERWRLRSRRREAREALRSRSMPANVRTPFGVCDTFARSG